MSVEGTKILKSYSEDSEGSSLWRDAWIRLRANRLATLSLFFFIFIAALTIIGPEIITTSYEEQNLNNTFAKPAIAKHVYGDREMSKTHHKVAPQANQPS